MKKYGLILVVAILIATMGFGASCKTTEQAAVITETTTETEAITTTETAAAKEKVTITAWISSTQPNALEKFVNSFNEAQDLYILKKEVVPLPFEQTFLTKWATGDRPDICQFHGTGNWFYQLNPTETLVDLSDMEFVGNSLYGFMDTTSRIGDKVYGPHINYATVFAMIYNKEVFDALDIGELPGNYDEFKKLCKVAKDAGYIPIYDAGGDQWPLQIIPYMFFASGFKDNPTIVDKINTNQGDFNNPIFLKSIEKYKELLDAGYFNTDILTATFDGGHEEIMSGKVAMLAFGGNYIIPTLIEKFGLDEVNKKIGMFTPSLDYSCAFTSPGTGWSNWYVPDTGDPEKIKGAKEFIKYLTGTAPYEKYYQTYCDETPQHPVFEGFKSPELDLPDQQLLKYVSASSDASWGKLKYAYGPFETFMQEMVAGIKTPLDVCKALSDEFRKSAETAGSPDFKK